MKRSCLTTQTAMLDCLASAQLATEHRQHLEHCLDCQALWASHTQALTMGARLQAQRANSPRPTDWIVQRVQARAGHREQSNAQGVSPWSRPWIWAIGAAVFALAVWVQLAVPPVPPSPGQPQTTIAPRVASTPQARQALSSTQERELNQRMAKAFASMNMTFAQDRVLILSTSPIEKAALLWDQDLEDEAKYSIALAMQSSAFELRDIDPSPISQALPPSLSALRPLVGMVSQREL